MCGLFTLQPLSLLLGCVLFVVSILSVEGHGKRSISQLTPKELNTLVSSLNASQSVDPVSPFSHLSKILIPRSPGTANSTLVRDYLLTTLRALKWHIEEDSFDASTPYGTKTFTNVIATKDPDAPFKFVMSAHYDSKFFPSYPKNQFVGATDSAAPCAMLLDLAQALDPLLDRRAERFVTGEDDEDANPAAYTTLQLIFFDGEEAYKEWSATDSTYGSRHLAERWSKTYVQPNPRQRLYVPATILSTIEHLVLLDLLGAPAPRVHSFYPSTAWLFDALVSAESRLQHAGFLVDSNAREPKKKPKSFFVTRKPTDGQNMLGLIDDDHMPFLKRGVNVLHLITMPFPTVWHTVKDDATALDLPTMRKWNLILRVFTAEYLGLRPEVPSSKDIDPIPKTELVRTALDVLQGVDGLESCDL